MKIYIKTANSKTSGKLYTALCTECKGHKTYCFDKVAISRYAQRFFEAHDVPYDKNVQRLIYGEVGEHCESYVCFD